MFALHVTAGHLALPTLLLLTLCTCCLHSIWTAACSRCHKSRIHQRHNACLPCSLCVLWQAPLLHEKSSSTLLHSLRQPDPRPCAIAAATRLWAHACACHRHPPVCTTLFLSSAPTAAAYTGEEQQLTACCWSSRSCSAPPPQCRRHAARHADPAAEEAELQQRLLEQQKQTNLVTGAAIATVEQGWACWRPGCTGKQWQVGCKCQASACCEMPLACQLGSSMQGTAITLRLHHPCPQASCHM